MATDLSKIIQEGLSSTLIGLLGKDATIDETTKVDPRDLDSYEFLQVTAEFNFAKLVTYFEFFIPATSASIIFNTMMSATDYDVASVIDDDTMDAMSEFISNLSGGLVTTFNNENLEELGQVKFNLQNKHIIKGDAIENIESIYRFSMHIEDKNILIFIRFDEPFLPHIEEIANSQVTYYPPEQEKRAKAEPEEIEKQAIDNKEEEKSEEEDIKKVKKLLNKKNIIIASSILILLIILAILFIPSAEEEVEEKEEKVTQEEPIKQEVKTIETEPLKTLKKVDFSVEDIDRARLNKRLSTLTKHQVLSISQIKEQERLEAQRLEKMYKEQELMEFAKLNKEEPVVLPSVQEDPQEETNNTTQDQKDDSTIEQIPQPQQPHYYLSTYSIKYTLYKDLITQNNSTTARISVCNDKNGKTTIFIGPFETDSLQMKMKTLIQNSAPDITTSMVTLTPEQFDQMCNL